MPLINVVVTLVIVGVVLWLINTYIPMQGTIKTILNWVVVIAVIIWLLSNATRREFGVEALVLAVAALFYFIRKRGGRL